MKSKTYYAIQDDSGCLYTFELQEDRLRNDSWYQVCSYPEITLAALYHDYDKAELDVQQILACKDANLKLKIIEVKVEIGKYA